MRIGLNNLGLSATPVFSPQSLFVNNEPGVHFEAYDPTALLTRRNWLTNSNDPNGSNWTKTDTTVGATSVVGGVTYTLLTEGTASTAGVVANNVITGAMQGRTFTNSVELVRGNHDWVRLRMTGTGSNAINAWFNLATGVKGSSGVSGTGVYVDHTMTSLGDGRYRCVLTAYIPGELVGLQHMSASADGNTARVNNATRYVANAQSELSSAFTTYQAVTDWNTEYMAAALESIGMWQDFAGIAPVTAVEQTVGAWFDSRLSKTWPRGTNVVANGTFNTDLTSWLDASTAPATLTWASGAAVLTRSDANNARIDQQLTTVAGTWYVVSADIGTTGLSVQVGATQGSSGILAAQGLQVGTGRSALFLATGTTSWVRFFTNTVGVSTLDNVTVRPLPAGINIATQGTAGSRPVLSARYNLLTKSEQFDDAAWTKNDSTITANATAAHDGTTTADLVTEGVAGTSSVFQTATVTASTAYTHMRHLKRGNHDWVRLYLGTTDGSTAGLRVWANLATGQLGNVTVVGAGTSGGATIADMGNGWYRVVMTATASTATTVSAFVASADGNGAVARVNNGTRYEWGADLRSANDAALSQPSYQRVNTSTDYDTAGFIHYLRFDGTDDFLATPSVDFSGVDKVAACVGTTKLIDAAAAGTIAELTVSSSATAGSFGIFAVASNPQYSMRSAGSVIAAGATTTPSNYAAPATSVLLLRGDISGDSLGVRVNGALVASSTADQGTGNYSNAVIYAGRRGGTALPYTGRITSLTIRGSTAATPNGEVFRMEGYTKQLAGQAFASA